MGLRVSKVSWSRIQGINTTTEYKIRQGALFLPYFVFYKPKFRSVESAECIRSFNLKKEKYRSSYRIYRLLSVGNFLCVIRSQQVNSDLFKKGDLVDWGRS